MGYFSFQNGQSCSVLPPNIFVSFYIFGNVYAMYSLSKISAMSNTGLNYIPNRGHFRFC